MNLFDYCYKLIPYKFIRFIIVGGINTCFGMGMYCLLIFIGFQYMIATLIAHVLGVFFNFLTTGKLVFNDTDKKKIFRFVISYSITYFINIGVNKFIQTYLDLNQYWSGVGATILTALSSFVIMNYFVYVKKGN